MRYAEYLARGLFIGSGVVEAGCKTVIGRRLKQSGMFWGVSGADRREALEGAQIVYAKEWAHTAAYGDESLDAQARRPLRDWCLTEQWFAGARSDCRVMRSEERRVGQE